MDTLQTPKTPLKTQKIRILGDAGILGGPGGLGSLTPIPGYGGCTEIALLTQWQTGFLHREMPNLFHQEQEVP